MTINQEALARVYAAAIAAGYHKAGQDFAVRDFVALCDVIEEERRTAIEADYQRRRAQMVGDGITVDGPVE